MKTVYNKKYNPLYEIVAHVRRQLGVGELKLTFNRNSASCFCIVRGDGNFFEACNAAYSAIRNSFLANFANASSYGIGVQFGDGSSKKVLVVNDLVTDALVDDKSSLETKREYNATALAQEVPLSEADVSCDALRAAECILCLGDKVEGFDLVLHGPLASTSRTFELSTQQGVAHILPVSKIAFNTGVDSSWRPEGQGQGFALIDFVTQSGTFPYWLGQICQNSKRDVVVNGKTMLAATYLESILGLTTESEASNVTDGEAVLIADLLNLVGIDVQDGRAAIHLVQERDDFYSCPALEDWLDRFRSLPRFSRMFSVLNSVVYKRAELDDGCLRDTLAVTRYNESGSYTATIYHALSRLVNGTHTGSGDKMLCNLYALCSALPTGSLEGFSLAFKMIFVANTLLLENLLDTTETLADKDFRVGDHFHDAERDSKQDRVIVLAAQRYATARAAGSIYEGMLGKSTHHVFADAFGNVEYDPADNTFAAQSVTERLSHAKAVPPKFGWLDGVYTKNGVNLRHGGLMKCKMGMTLEEMEGHNG